MTTDKRSLQWFFDLMYADIPRMPQDEFFDLVAELNQRLGSPLGYGVWIDQQDRYRTEITTLREGLRHFFEAHVIPKIIEVEQSFVSSTEDSAIPGGTTVRREQELTVILSPVPFQAQIKSSVVIDVLVLVGAMEPGKRSFRRKFAGGFEDVRFRTDVQREFDAEGLLYHFLTTLSGVALAALGKCRGCDKWFVRISTRSRDYCDQACASRDGQRRRRREIRGDPQKYEEYKRRAKERATASYEKKQKATHPKAKIQKRVK